MFDCVELSSQPMLYVTTSCSARPSTIASEVKASLAAVRELLERGGAAPAGRPIISYSNHDGRLVTIEAGYPVADGDAARAAGRVLAGHTPSGMAATVVHRGGPASLEAARAQLPAEVTRQGGRVTGLTWESYLDGDGAGPGNTTALYVQLLERPGAQPAPFRPV